MCAHDRPGRASDDEFTERDGLTESTLYVQDHGGDGYEDAQTGAAAQGGQLGGPEGAAAPIR